MDLKIKYEEVWKLILQLSAKQLGQLKKDLSSLSEKRKPEQEGEDFQQFLLQGPTMAVEQYDQFKENRKYVSEWMKR